MERASTRSQTDPLHTAGRARGRGATWGFALRRQRVSAHRIRATSKKSGSHDWIGRTVYLFHQASEGHLAQRGDCVTPTANFYAPRASRELTLAPGVTSPPIAVEQMGATNQNRSGSPGRPGTGRQSSPWTRAVYPTRECGHRGNPTRNEDFAIRAGQTSRFCCGAPHGRTRPLPPPAPERLVIRTSPTVRRKPHETISSLSDLPGCDRRLRQ